MVKIITPATVLHRVDAARAGDFSGKVFWEFGAGVCAPAGNILLSHKITTWDMGCIQSGFDSLPIWIKLPPTPRVGVDLTEMSQNNWIKEPL